MLNTKPGDTGRQGQNGCCIHFVFVLFEKISCWLQRTTCQRRNVRCLLCVSVDLKRYKIPLWIRFAFLTGLETGREQPVDGAGHKLRGRELRSHSLHATLSDKSCRFCCCGLPALLFALPCQAHLSGSQIETQGTTPDLLNSPSMNKR